MQQIKLNYLLGSPLALHFLNSLTILGQKTILDELSLRKLILTEELNERKAQ